MPNSSLTPTLRFPGFSGEWEEKRLMDIGENIIGLTYSPKNVTNDDSYPIVLRSSNIKNDKLIFDDIVRVNCKIVNKLLIRPDDILICTRNGSQRLIGKSVRIGKLQNPTTFGAFMSVYRSPQNHFNSQLFLTSRFYKQVQKNLGARINQITTGYLNKFKFNYPTEEEQQIISSFLEKTDSWIENLKQQKTELEKYKKGMIQKIFAQEIRFKDKKGNVFPEWKENKMGEILIEVEEKTSESDQYPILSSTISQICLQSEYFKKTIASKNNTGYKIIRENQLVFSPQNLWLGNINICEQFKIGIVSPSYKIFKNKENVLLIKYLKYLIKTPRMLYEYMISSEQGASIVRRNLNMELFNTIKVFLPSIPEQQKIADFLSSIDKVIQSKQLQISQAEKWKKGLMQGLFV